MLTWKMIAGLVAMISCTVVGNVFIKIGASGDDSSRLFGLIAPQTILGVSFFVLALLFYAWVLKVLPLNVAQSFAAAQFVSVIIASSVFLAEPIPLIRWIGIALIAAGIVVVGVTASNGAIGR